jgi:glycosyltransferase involved in cell wall biosynthesis
MNELKANISSIPLSKRELMVSVCIQTYNHEKYIAQCLENVLNQKANFLWEIILGEDESSDSTREICIDYSRRFPDKIKLFLHSRSNVIYVNGNATGRNNLIQNLTNAKGKYIALCEGDDYWTDQYKLQKQVDFLEANPDCVSCHH